MWLTRGKVHFLIFFFCLSLVGCTRDAPSQTSDKIIIYAASSLTNVLTELENEFERRYPEIDVQISFAGSKTLRSQIENGAQPDLFLSANEKHYQALAEEEIFLRGGPLVNNSMVLIVHKEIGDQVNGLEDLRLNLKLVLAEESVPAGAYANRVIESYDKKNGNDYKKKLMNNVVSKESNVRQVLMKVALGEADAGIVYRTDVVDSVKEALKLIEIPPANNIVATYYAGILRKEHTESADLYFDFLYSQDAQAIFKKYGFLPR